ncbi:MAG: putative ABC transporter permease [Roseburia sp.]|nr:putative ABC transporter permease [Roseburia sp.]
MAVKRKYNIYALSILMMIVSFLGFVLENIWLAITKGYINNRNMNLPFLLGYGLIVVFMYFLFGTPSEMVLMGKFPVKASKWIRWILYFICAMFFVSVGEILLGIVTEKLCHIQYWNYSELPLHITIYTSVPTSIGFSFIISMFMGHVFHPIMNWVSGMNPGLVKAIALVGMFLLIGDFIISYGNMIRSHNFYIKWKLLL